jgi:hypothetical protein
MIPNQSYSSIFIEEGGWTRYKQTLRANFVNLVNKHNKKLGTLICSARADRLVHRRRPSRLRTARLSAHFGAQHMPLPFGGAEQTKINFTSVFLSILPHTRIVLLEETPIQSFGQIFAL